MDCEFPHSAEALYARLAQTRYDLLHLQASSQIARATLLPALPPLIRRARGASANAQVVVLVAGRLFDQRPGLSALVGADADALEHGATPREIAHVLALKASRRGTAPLRFAEAVIAEVGQAMLERPDPADAPQVPRAHRPNGAASAGKPHARRGTA
ncbi:MAG: hypothetical protein N2688_15140 [Burkholderiaceae bacterium]|nr:hypothetical protein [Burkholderiaceae bacterium]